MSLADFWENITTPGFLSASFDELKELGKEIKSDVQNLVEEGEELFTDGFKEMVLNDNNDYKTSINKRHEGQEVIKDLRRQCLDARGIDDDFLPVVKVMENEFKLIIDAIEEFEVSEIEEVNKALQNDFAHLIFEDSRSLMEFRNQVAGLLEVTQPPAYKAPPSNEKIRRLGPVGVCISDKEKRVLATEKYLTDIEDYKKQIELEIKAQQAAGPLFDKTALTVRGGELVVTLGERFWEVNNIGASGPLFPMILSDEDTALEEKEKRMRGLLLLAAGICSAVKCAITTTSGKNGLVTAEMLKELEHVEKLTLAIVGDDRNEPVETEDETKKEIKSLEESFH